MLSRQLWQTPVILLRISVFNDSILAVDISECLQLLETRFDNRSILVSEKYYTDTPWSRGLLRTRSKRPARPISPMNSRRLIQSPRRLEQAVLLEFRDQGFWQS
jgi:hypothetical protein